MEVYEPREDSFLLEKYVKQLAKGVVLDMGTGSGIQARAAEKNAEFVIAVDINQQALTKLNEHITSNKIFILKSDLFEFFTKKCILIKEGVFKGITDANKEKNVFDTIIFNAPYLPSDPKDEDVALDGGKEGYEVIERFLSQAKEFLADDGIMLLIFSSLTNKEKVDALIKENGFSSEECEKIHVSFEDIFCYKLWKENS